jgi:hypothetical protein
VKRIQLRLAIALASVFCAVATLGLGATSASAVSLDNVTGGQSGLFVSIQQVGDLARAGIYVTPVSPSYLTYTLDEGPALRFPITGGAVESSTMLGTVNHAGGMTLQKVNPDGSNGPQLTVTDVKIVAGASLVGNALGLIPAPTADLVNATHSKNPATGVIHYEADARLNLVTATVLNTYLQTNFFKDGYVLGHLKSDIQTKKLLGL